MNNAVGTVFKVISIVIWVLGGFATFLLVLAAFDEGEAIYFLYCLLSLVGSFVLGMIPFGFGEIINLLQRIDYAIRQKQ